MVDSLVAQLSQFTGTKFEVLRGRVPVPDRPGQVWSIRKRMMYGLRATRGEWSHTFQAHRPMNRLELQRWLASICDMLQMGFIPVMPQGYTGMRAVAEALGFEPDNHHNASRCPYCQEHHNQETRHDRIPEPRTD